MKGKISLIGFSLFFLLSIMMETYCMLELRDDIITVVGMGVVVLIAAFLVLDVLINQFINRNSIKDSHNMDYTIIEKKLEAMENIQKAIYVSTKKGYNLLENKFTLLQNDIEFHISSLLEEQKRLNDTIIKYSSISTDILDNSKSSLSKIDDVDNMPSKNENTENQQNNQNFEEKLLALDIDVSDQNKSLSPDEIATLFDRLG